MGFSALENLQYLLTTLLIHNATSPLPTLLLTNMKTNPTCQCTSSRVKHPFRRGITLYIGRNKSDICPVDAMPHYLVLRGNHPGTLFRFASGASLTRACLVNRLKQALTTAANLGLEDSLIKTLGRWESAAYLRYVSISKENLAQVSSVLCHAPSPPPQRLPNHNSHQLHIYYIIYMHIHSRYHINF